MKLWRILWKIYKVIKEIDGKNKIYDFKVVCGEINDGCYRINIKVYDGDKYVKVVINE